MGPPPVSIAKAGEPAHGNFELDSGARGIKRKHGRDAHGSEVDAASGFELDGGPRGVEHKNERSAHGFELDATSGTNSTFQDYLRSVSTDELKNITSDYYAYADAEDAWSRSHPRAKRRTTMPRVTQKRTSRLMRHKLAIGVAFKRWRETEEGRNAKDFLSAFCKSNRPYDGAVPKKDKEFLKRCIRIAETADGSYVKVGRHRPTSAEERRPNRYLCRQRNLQGRPKYGGPLDEQLWDWFVDIRGSVAYFLPPKLVLMKAKQISTTIIRCMAETGSFVQMPKLEGTAGLSWLRRWCQNHGVVLRKPNRRFKASKTTLRKRLRAMWRNNIVVRRLAERTLGHSLPIYGIDQKGIHMNEAGSRNAGTVHLFLRGLGSPVHGFRWDRGRPINPSKPCATRRVKVAGFCHGGPRPFPFRPRGPRAQVSRCATQKMLLPPSSPWYTCDTRSSHRASAN